MLHRDQLWGCTKVVVPQAMMHCLEMPDAFACARVQRQDALVIQIVADAIGPIIIEGGRAEGKIDDAIFFIHSDFAPGVHAARVFVRVPGPGFITVFPWKWNRMKYPNHLPGYHAVRPDMSGAGEKVLAG